METSAPARANASAKPSPIPEFLPVTTATFPVRSKRSVMPGIMPQGAGNAEAPHVPDRAHLPLLPSGPGGVQRDAATRGVAASLGQGLRAFQSGTAISPAPCWTGTLLGGGFA